MGRCATPLVAAAAALVALAPTGCGGADDVRPAAAVSRASDDTHGRFIELPRYPKSEPTGPAFMSSAGLIRAFRATEASAESVLEFYVDALVEWTVVDEPREFGARRMRARWRDGSYRLTINAIDAGTGTTEFHVVLAKR